MASRKFLNVNCLRMASPSSVHPFKPSSRCSASARDSFMTFILARLKPRATLWHRASRYTSAHRLALRLGATRADLVEADARRFDRVERLFLQLDGAGPLRRTRKCAAGD